MKEKEVVAQTDAKIIAMLNEFSWIRGFIPDRRIDSVTVRVVNPELMQLKSRAGYAQGLEPAIGFFHHDGVFIGQVAWKKILGDPDRPWWKIWISKKNRWEQMPKEKVWGALDRLEAWEKTRYILVATEVPSRSKHINVSVVVYRVPKSYNLKDWVDKEMRREMAEIKSELSEFDTEK